MLSVPEAHIEVLVADGSPIMRKLVSQLLGQEPLIRVVGNAGTVNEALSLVADLAPDVMLLDLNLNELDEYPPSLIKIGFLSCVRHIVAMSTRQDAEEQSLARSYGAVQLLDKFWLAERLIPTIVGCNESFRKPLSSRRARTVPLAHRMVS